jgi:hypothetical protein
MPETKQLTFTHKEVAAALLKGSDLHEGHWGVLVHFGIGGANVGLPPNNNLLPAAIVPILSIGLQRFDEPNDLTVDAAKVNPVKKVSARKR